MMLTFEELRLSRAGTGWFAICKPCYTSAKLDSVSTDKCLYDIWPNEVLQTFRETAVRHGLSISYWECISCQWARLAWKGLWLLSVLQMLQILSDVEQGIKREVAAITAPGNVGLLSKQEKSSVWVLSQKHLNYLGHWFILTCKSLCYSIIRVQFYHSSHTCYFTCRHFIES